MDYTIRKLSENEYSVLNDFLYQAIFIPEGVEPPPFEIIFQPELQVYTKDFGTSPHDRALCAEVGGKIVGAVWVRIMDDYGHIAEDVPSFAVSLYPEYRNHGIGTALMRGMLDELKHAGYRRVSLAVQKANYAVKMYRKLGFYTIDENAEEFIMQKNLGFTIRQMNIDDYDTVYALWLSCKGMGLNDIDDSRVGIAAFLDRNPTTCFVAEQGGNIVGVIMTGHDGRRGYVYHTAVCPDARHQGIASAMVQTALDALRTCGIHKVALVVFERNADGNAFWERQGFTGREDLVYRNRALSELKRIDT